MSWCNLTLSSGLGAQVEKEATTAENVRIAAEAARERAAALDTAAAADGEDDDDAAAAAGEASGSVYQVPEHLSLEHLSLLVCLPPRARVFLLRQACDTREDAEQVSGSEHRLSLRLRCHSAKTDGFGGGAAGCAGCPDEQPGAAAAGLTRPL